MGHIISGFIINKSEIYTCTTNDNDYNSEHRKMRAKQQHVCKEMNQYTNNTNRKWFLSFSIEWTIGANDRKQPINQNKK